MPGEQIDLVSVSALGSQGVPCNRRPFLGIHFACCGYYVRVYANRSNTAYEGNCPGCSRPVRVRIGPGGSQDRFFTAY
jgi:hypothetical protein